MRLKEFTNANWKTIAARNNLANPDLIMPGQVLDVGDGLVLPKGTTYIVKSGDTLSGIAQKIRRGWLPGTASPGQRRRSLRCQPPASQQPYPGWLCWSKASSSGTVARSLFYLAHRE